MILEPGAASAMSTAALAWAPACGWTLAYLAPKTSLARSRARFSMTSTCSHPP